MSSIEQILDQLAEIRKQGELKVFIEKQQERIAYTGNYIAYKSLDAAGYMNYWGIIGGLFEEIDKNMKIGKHSCTVPQTKTFQVNQLLLLNKPTRILKKFVPQFLYGDRNNNKTVLALGDAHPASPDASYFLMIEVGKQSFDGIKMLERIKKNGGAVADYVGCIRMNYDRYGICYPVVSGRLGHVDSFSKDRVNGFEPNQDLYPQFYTLPCERAYELGSYLSIIFNMSYPLSPDLYDPSTYVHTVDPVA